MAEDTITGLPVLGYQEQSRAAIDDVNANKELEERLLRRMDAMKDQPDRYDPRWLSIARTDIEKGFMALNRAVFKPKRARLEGDKIG